MRKIGGPLCQDAAPYSPQERFWHSSCRNRHGDPSVATSLDRRHSECPAWALHMHLSPYGLPFPVAPVSQQFARTQVVPIVYDPFAEDIREGRIRVVVQIRK